MFIISDGCFGDRKKSVQEWLRRASERNTAFSLCCVHHPWQLPQRKYTRHSKYILSKQNKLTQSGHILMNFPFRLLHHHSAKYSKSSNGSWRCFETTMVWIDPTEIVSKRPCFLSKVGGNKFPRERERKFPKSIVIHYKKTNSQKVVFLSFCDNKSSSSSSKVQSSRNIMLYQHRLFKKWQREFEQVVNHLPYCIMDWFFLHVLPFY